MSSAPPAPAAATSSAPTVPPAKQQQTRGNKATGKEKPLSQQGNKISPTRHFNSHAPPSSLTQNVRFRFHPIRCRLFASVSCHAPSLLHKELASTKEGERYSQRLETLQLLFHAASFNVFFVVTGFGGIPLRPCALRIT